MNLHPLGPVIVIVLVAILLIALSIRRLRTLRHAPVGKARRITERVLLCLAIFICAFLACTTIYNAAALRYYRAIYPPPGKIYQVNGYDMHLYCTGEGSPTLILEAGWGSNSAAWTKVQPELSKITRVCSYDRAGFGWSTPQPPPRDADTIARQLHLLLQQAGIQGPLVLMGHSAGGLYIRDYASHYPNDIVGLIFVDAPTPSFHDRLSPELRPFDSVSPSFYYALAAATEMGLHRVMGECAPEPGFDLATGTRIAQLQCGILPSSFWKEYLAERQVIEETANTGPYGDVPVLIFTRDPKLDQQSGRLPPRLALELVTVWGQEQDGLKRLSTRSRRIIAKGSRHQIPYDRADLLNREVTTFIQQLRTNEPRTDYGSTTTE